MTSIPSIAGGRVVMPSELTRRALQTGLTPHAADRISGNVLGAKTDTKAAHDRKDISGNPSEGPSEVETTHSAEGRQRDLEVLTGVPPERILSCVGADDDSGNGVRKVIGGHDLAIAQAADFLGVALNDGLAHRNLAVTRHHDLAVLADRQDGRGVPARRR